MTRQTAIPAFGLYGEQDPFPDVVHCEALSARAPQNDWRILPHRHDHMAQLLLLRDGHVQASVDNRRHDLAADQILFIPRGVVHGFLFRPESEGTVISFPQTVVESVSPDTARILRALSAPLVGQLTPVLVQLVTVLEAAAARSGPFRAQQIVGLAHSVLSHLAELQVETGDIGEGRHPARLAKLDGLIADHIAEGWTASEYATRLAVTTGHLSRLCRRATGLGASAYIEHRVMAEACRLLAFTQLPVAQVGYRLGYEDPSYFSKRFRAAFGQTPSAYRSRFTHSDRMALPAHESA